ncbi:MAG: thioesterase domain-containing protein, partial [Ramlibacter sp.]
DGYLSIVGRVSEVINRGGEKVFPYEVEKALLQHPAVLEGAAFGVPHPRLGESVAAAVILKPGAQASEQELKEFLGTRLAGYKLPRRLWLLASLPRGSTGKVLRSALAAAYSASRHEVVAPDRLLELELRDIWERLLATDDIGIDDDFFEIGGDSLLATEMLLEVEGLAGKPYPQSGLATLTIRHMAEVLTSGMPAERDLITQVKSGPGMPLFFCHGDYVARGIYAQQLAALLPDDQPVYLLNCYADRLLGTSIEEIARAYLPGILRVTAPGSTVTVGGYCNGGLIAWQIAHLLRAQGVQVAEVLLIETMSLNARPDLRILPRVLAAAGSVVPGRPGRFLREQAMGALWVRRRRLGGLSYPAVRRKILAPRRRGQPAGLRNDAFDVADEVYFGLMSRYVPPRIDVGVTCFIAQQGQHFDTAPSFWRKLATRAEAVSVPGTHHSAVISGRQALASALAAILKKSGRSAAAAASR